MGTSQQMGKVRQIQMPEIQVQNPSEQCQPSAQIIVCSNIDGLLIHHWGNIS
jgi:hypothetical protein